MEETFTLDEIKRAFWNNFHEKGEFWFGYLGSPHVNEEMTEHEWNEFEERLMDAKT
jgi:hypothetical protein